MPIYGYRCSQCGHELEVFQSMSAEPLRVCPECGGGLNKLLYPVGVHFKGSGFYSTDYKNGGSKAKSGEKSDKAEKTEKSDSGGSDSGSGSKTESASSKTSESGSSSTDKSTAAAAQ